MKYNLSRPENWRETICWLLQEFLKDYNRVPKYLVLGEDTCEKLRQELEYLHGVETLAKLTEYSGMKIRVGNFGAKGREKRFIGFMLE